MDFPTRFSEYNSKPSRDDRLHNQVVVEHMTTNVVVKVQRLLSLSSECQNDRRQLLLSIQPTMSHTILDLSLRSQVLASDCEHQTRVATFQLDSTICSSIWHDASVLSCPDAIWDHLRTIVPRIQCNLLPSNQLNRKCCSRCEWYSRRSSIRSDRMWLHHLNCICCRFPIRKMVKSLFLS